ncbi:MAG: hypothetical protein WC479_08460 [Candidatus Izemoplasmatales bacterium]
MDIAEILEDIEESNESVKISPRVFIQIEVFWPKNERGEPVSDEQMFPIIRKKHLKKMQPIGYVNVANGFGSLSVSCPGYWIIVKEDTKLWKIKMGKSYDEFAENLLKMKEWKGITQIFL